MENNQTTTKPQSSLMQNKRIRIFLLSIIVIAVLGVGMWWAFFRAFVSTNDSRVATNILRIVPVGVGGLIEKVNVEEGTVVKAGQVIVEIDHRLPEAQLHRAKARYELALVEYKRNKSLFESHSEPQKDFDNARANLGVAEAELKLAQVTLENTYLKSPIDGIVIQKIAEQGNTLEPGQVAVTISDVAHAWVNANIEETQIAKVKPGQSVQIKIDEGGQLKGVVQEIGATTTSQFSLIPAENAGGNFTKIVQRIPVKIKLLPHPDHAVLRAGQSVTVKIRVL